VNQAPSALLFPGETVRTDGEPRVLGGAGSQGLYARAGLLICGELSACWPGGS
jgi:hypothetical protein